MCANIHVHERMHICLYAGVIDLRAGSERKTSKPQNVELFSEKESHFQFSSLKKNNLRFKSQPPVPPHPGVGRAGEGMAPLAVGRMEPSNKKPLSHWIGK